MVAKCSIEIAPAAHARMQMPQPLHLTSSTTAFFATEEIALRCGCGACTAGDEA